MMKTRTFFNLFLLFLIVTPLTGCRQRTETLLLGYAEDVASALDFDILHEEHDVIWAPIDSNDPSSWISSRYWVSESPKEIIERLNALHHGDRAWTIYESGEWIGETPLRTGIEFESPEDQRDGFRYLLPSRPGADGFGVESRLNMDYLLICPWFGVGEDLYTTLYSDAFILAEDGTLVIVIHASGWNRCHGQRVGGE